MMKWSFAIHALAGCVLIVPAISIANGGGQGGARDLEQSLERTLREIEQLAGLRARLEKGDRGAVALVRDATDPPSPDARAADDRLARLRRDVSRLQMVHDGLAVEEPAGDAHLPAPAPSTPTTVLAGLHSFEEPGFSADPLREGEACYRAGRFAQCIEVLAKIPNDPRARYWTGRALEKVGQDDDAIAIYAKLADAKDGGWVADRARGDLDYLRWKKAHGSPASPTVDRAVKPE